MSDRVTTILEAVKALPEREKAEFTELFHHWVSANHESQSLSEKPEWPDFAGRIRAIFGERILPGDPQEFWDEERGR